MKKIKALILSSLLCISAVGCSSKVNDNDVVATVNGKDITAKQFQLTLDLYKESLESMYGTSIWDTEVEDGVKYKDKFKEMILDQMIDMEAVYQQAEKDKLAASEEEVNQSFEELKKSLDEDEEYKKKLEELGIDDTYLKAQQAQDLTIQKYKENFDNTVEISDEEMKTYYEEHKDDYYKDEVKASHILISTVDDNGKELSDEKKKEAKEKAEDVLKKVNSGEEFSEIAKEYSDDTASGSQGGDLGYFGKGQMVQAFEDAAFSLQPGEISDIVETEFGYHIIKVYDKIDEQLPFDDVKEEIKATLTENKYIDDIEKITENAKVEKNESIINKIKF